MPSVLLLAAPPRSRLHSPTGSLLNSRVAASCREGSTTGNRGSTLFGLSAFSYVDTPSRQALISNSVQDYKELLHAGADIESSSLKAQKIILDTDVVCTDQLTVVVDDLSQPSWRGHMMEAPERRPQDHRSGCTGGTMLSRSVPGPAICPRACRIERCCGIQSDPAARLPDQLSPRDVGPRTSSANSRLFPLSRLCLGQVLLGGEIVAPTITPIGTRG